jgi:hypothetical protein
MCKVLPERKGYCGFKNQQKNNRGAAKKQSRRKPSLDRKQGVKIAADAVW